MYMTYSIKNFLVSLCLFCGLSCGPSSLTTEEYQELCPYERNWGIRHFYLEAPLYVEPAKQTHRVGDTLTITVAMSDDIYDLNRETNFKIKHFPFKPAHLLYRIDSTGWSSGYWENEVLVDTIFSPILVDASVPLNRAASLNGRTTYENGNYLMVHKLVLRTPGKYIHLAGDGITAITATEEKISEELFPEYYDVTNDSGCPDPHYLPSYVYQGNPYYEAFSTEMKYLDEVVHRGGMFEIGMDWEHPIWGGLDEFGGWEDKSLSVDHHAVFGFEVVE